jgi:hypothetical protein
VTRYLVLPAAAAVLIASAVAHGLLTNRWGPSAELRAAADRLGAVPARIGEWQGHDLEVNPRQLAVAEAVGHLSRRYVNRGTGDEVTLLLLCGRPGPISLHPPAVCYQSAGYTQMEGEEPYVVKGPTGPLGTLTVVRASREGATPDPLRIFWGWSDGGPFEAPEDARTRFRRSPYLYKVYVVRRLSRADEPLGDDDPAVLFLRELLPVLRTGLAPAP